MSWAVWITGLPGSGKSVVARAVAGTLQAGGKDVRVLELDAIRRVITPAATYTDAEREAVYRALVYIGSVALSGAYPLAARIGDPIDRPWTGVQLVLEDGVALPDVEPAIRQTVQTELEQLSEFRTRLARGELPVC